MDLCIGTAYYERVRQRFIIFDMTPLIIPFFNYRIREFSVPVLIIILMYEYIDSERKKSNTCDFRILSLHFYIHNDKNL